MAEQGKDSAGPTLLRNLLVSIAGDARIKKALQELGDVGGKELIREIVGELGAVIERMKEERLARYLDPGPLKTPDFGLEGGSADVLEVPVPVKVPQEAPPLVEPPVVSKDQPVKEAARPFEKTEVQPPVAEVPASQPEREQESAPPLAPPAVPPMVESVVAAPPAEEEVHDEENFVALTKKHQVRIPVDLADEDWVYFHGVSPLAGDEQPSAKPFMMEEKGIDNREFAFALDHGHLRFYLSRILEGSMNVSKNGTVLLNKQDSLRMRGLHASILNDLRVYGVVLPFEFGTVALGKAHLMERIEGDLSDISAAVDELTKTSVWCLTVSMLDARLAQLLGTEKVAPQRERDRPSYQQFPTQRRIDIKTMERMLKRQKSLAESIHEELSQIAEKSKVEMMVGLSSGTSDDWKPILKARYEVHPRWVARLNRTVTDLQYRHLVFELMLTLSGEQEYYSFQKRK